MKSASCYGRQFRPLEVSDDGLKFMVELLKRALKGANEALENIKSGTMTFSSRDYRGKEFTWAPGDADYDMVQLGRIDGKKSEILGIVRDLDMFNEKVSNWKAT
jgi:hypothetical protein